MERKRGEGLLISDNDAGTQLIDKGKECSHRLHAVLVVARRPACNWIQLQKCS